MGSISGSGRVSGRWYGNPLQYSCLENPMDKGAWQATVHLVAKGWMQLKQLSVHVCMIAMWVIGASSRFFGCMKEGALQAERPGKVA